MPCSFCYRRNWFCIGVFWEIVAIPVICLESFVIYIKLGFLTKSFSPESPRSFKRVQCWVSFKSNCKLFVGLPQLPFLCWEIWFKWFPGTDFRECFEFFPIVRCKCWRCCGILLESPSWLNWSFHINETWQGKGHLREAVMNPEKCTDRLLQVWFEPSRNMYNLWLNLNIFIACNFGIF